MSTLSTFWVKTKLLNNEFSGRSLVIRLAAKSQVVRAVTKWYLSLGRKVLSSTGTLRWLFCRMHGSSTRSHRFCLVTVTWCDATGYWRQGYPEGREGEKEKERKICTKEKCRIESNTWVSTVCSCRHTSTFGFI